MPNPRHFHKAIAVMAVIAFLAGGAILGVSLLSDTQAEASADVQSFTTDVSYAPKGIERFGVTDIRALPTHEADLH